jgi:hypothetical protein
LQPEKNPKLDFQEPLWSAPDIRRQTLSRTTANNVAVMLALDFGSVNVEAKT